MSPGDRSYDAIGWMRQISPIAREILGSETPKALPKDASGNDKRDGDQENKDPHNQPGNHCQLASNALVKLDSPNTHRDFLLCLFPCPCSLFFETCLVARETQLSYLKWFILSLFS